MLTKSQLESVICSIVSNEPFDRVNNEVLELSTIKVYLSGLDIDDSTDNAKQVFNELYPQLAK